ncbi:UNVERIFIED_CONTAM: hypothetical protein B566_EDAN016689 [Ephemera danica]|nr:hypothetical protein B566_EDAN016689 [Ephemera danica]
MDRSRVMLIIFLSYASIFVFSSADLPGPDPCPANETDCEKCVTFVKNNCSMVWLKDNKTVCTDNVTAFEAESFVTTSNGCKSMATCIKLMTCETCVNTTVTPDSKDSTAKEPCTWNIKLEKCALNFTHFFDFDSDVTDESQCKNATTTTTTTTSTTTPSTTTPTTPTTTPTTTTLTPPTTTTPVTTLAPNTTTVTPANTTTTAVPVTTPAMPTPAPSSDRRFDGPSFIVN